MKIIEGAPLVVDRISEIADMMAQGRWRTRLSARDLAAKWGVSASTVENHASEAARLLIIPPEERAKRRAAMAAWFEAVANDSMERRSIITGLPDTAAALKALELYGKYAGLEPTDADATPPVAPTRVVVTFEEPTKKEPTGE